MRLLGLGAVARRDLEVWASESESGSACAAACGGDGGVCDVDGDERKKIHRRVRGRAYASAGLGLLHRVHGCESDRSVWMIDESANAWI